LVGHGDSTKTTILDAIEYVLNPFWSIAVEDTDFHLIETENPIIIEVSISDVPKALLSEEKFGLFTRGWNLSNGINDEPIDGDELILTIRLKVTDSLDPEWTVINERDDEGKRISHRDRQVIHLSRLGIYSHRHFSWSKGSSLTRLTETTDEASSILLKAARQIRSAADFSELIDFSNVATQTQTEATKLGVKPKSSYAPGMDGGFSITGPGSISIFDGKIPIRLSGLGTKRLITLAIQLQCIQKNSLLLIDELETGLEPHRLRHLIRHLIKNCDAEDGTKGQVFFTTHSSIAIAEIGAEKLWVVRSDNGVTTCTQVPDTLIGTVRALPESLLAKRIIVCEGKTEIGLVWSLEKNCIENHKDPFTYKGVVAAYGEGDNSTRRALALSQLGYETCAFLDSDKLEELSPSVAELQAAGIKVFHWQGAYSSEERLMLDLPEDVLAKVWAYGIEIFNNDTIHNFACSYSQVPKDSFELTLASMKTAFIDPVKVRTTIGKVSKKMEWFKRIDRGMELGEIIFKSLHLYSQSPFGKTISELESWIYG